MSNNVYQMITDRIIAALESGSIPWEKPWVNTSGTNLAVSHNDGRKYSLLNQMLLGIPGEYVTYKQAEKEGGHVKKGAKSGKVFFFKMIARDRLDMNGNVVLDDDGNPVKQMIPILQYTSVFHIEDTEGVDRKFTTTAPMPADNLPIETIDKAVSEYLGRSGVTLRHYQQGRSYYAPYDDEIILPHMNQFQNAESYYATLFHELGHSTGVQSRLNRPMGTRFGDDQYSREELVAEITSAVLCNYFGIDTSRIQRNTAAYVQGWLKAIKEDSRMVVVAASKAEKAVKFILNQQDEEAPEIAV